MAIQVLIIGHSFVDRLEQFVQTNDRCNLWLDRCEFTVTFHGQSGLSLQNGRLASVIHTVQRLRPHAVIVDIGANDIDRNAEPSVYGLRCGC